jgi:hypothetical protein
MNDFYTYAYLREDGTPYYIGKGRGNRAYKRNSHEAKCPPIERILILKKNLTEEQAFAHERYLIYLYGKKVDGSGILWNFADGGEGCSGVVRSQETRRKIAAAKIGNNNPMKREEVRKKASEAKKGKPNPSQTIKILGRRHWVNERGEGKLQVDCPGEGWQPGKGKRKQGKTS